VKENKVVIQAYNLFFPENDFCAKIGCLRDKLKLGLGKEAEKCRSIHAEAHLLTLAAQRGIKTKGATVYLTSQPCMNCAKLLYCSGIKEVYFLYLHADRTGKVFLEKMGVVCQQVKLPNDDPSLRLRDITGQKL
jgi:dCMP deaminase